MRFVLLVQSIELDFNGSNPHHQKFLVFFLADLVLLVFLQLGLEC